jgi:hypothetical protein
MKARFLKASVVRELYNQIPMNLDQYISGSFEYIESDSSLCFEGSFEINTEELSKINCDGEDSKEVQNCALLFNAMKEVTPYVARDERLWVYLTHTFLLNYSRKRWPIPMNSEKAIDYIRLHFFASGKRGIERNNAVSRLWWMANLCSRVNGLSLTEALECFLYQTDVRANIIERPTTSQSVRIFSAILKKLYESFRGDKILFDRVRFRSFMKELNLQGGVKLLEALDDDDITRILTQCI